MKKKSWIWSLILLFSIVTGCSGGNAPQAGSDAGDKPSDNPPAQDAVTLDFWYGWTGPEAEALEALIAKWNSANPDIQVKGLSQSDYQKQLTAITGAILRTSHPNSDKMSCRGDSVAP